MDEKRPTFMVRVRDPQRRAGHTVVTGLELFTAKMVARCLNAESKRLLPHDSDWELDLYMVELDREVRDED